MKKLTKLSAVIMTAFLLLSCGQKNIWEDIEKEGFTQDILTSAKDGKYDLNVMSDEGYTILTKYISELSFYDYKDLVKAGADINLKDNNGNYPLFVVLTDNHFWNKYEDKGKIAEDLIKNVNDINVLDSKGRNALSYADACYFEAMIDKGIDTSVVDKVYDIWPVFSKMSWFLQPVLFLNLLDEKNFKICSDESWLDDEEPEVKTSYYLVKHYLENKANPEKIVQNNEVEELDEEEKRNRLVLPSLLCDWDDSFEYNTRPHYLMTDIVLENGADYHIGDKVTILGYCSDEEGQGETEVVDGYAALNYEVKIGNSVTVLSGRYISMFDSIKDIDGNGKEDMLLSTYAYKWEDFSYYSDTIPFYLFTDPDTKMYSVDVIFVKNGVAQKLEPQNKDSFLCDRMVFADGNQIGSCPIIVAQQEENPVEVDKQFSFICGNKIIPITTKLFSRAMDPYDVIYGYDKYSLIECKYDDCSKYKLELYYLERYGEAMENLDCYCHEYESELPFVFTEKEPYLEGR